MIPKQLIGYINSGKCLVLVGSGPSTALGYLSWRSLAEHTVNLVSNNTPANYDASLYKALLKSKVAQGTGIDLRSRSGLAPLITTAFRRWGHELEREGIGQRSGPPAPMKRSLRDETACTRFGIKLSGTQEMR